MRRPSFRAIIAALWACARHSKCSAALKSRKGGSLPFLSSKVSVYIIYTHIYTLDKQHSLQLFPAQRDFNGLEMDSMGGQHSASHGCFCSMMLLQMIWCFKRGDC